MTPDTWSAVDHYISDLLIGPDAALDAVLASSAAAGLPSIQVSAPQGKFLHLLALAMGAKRILEIGTLGGYSAIWLARALPRDGTGKLVTLEYEPKHAEVARANLARAGLAGLVDVRVGRAIDTLPKLHSEKAGPFDLVFLDADKTGYPDYLEWCVKLSRPGAVIIADNVVRKGAVADAASTDANVRGVRRFNELADAHPRLTATAVQTVGGKGYDGFVMAVVTHGAVG